MKFRLFGLLALLLCVSSNVSAQGIFDALSFPTTVVATGQTELAGPLIVSLRTGTTVSGTLLIDLAPFRITNRNASDIRVTATSITVGATTLDTDASQIRIPVNAGASAGSIRVDGIRLAVAGTGATSITAKLSWENSLNVLSSGGTLTLVNAVRTGLVADPITDRFVIFNGQVVDANSKITLREGFASAFTNSTDFGQNVPTRIRVRITDMPTGLVLTFPATVAAKTTAATLTTVGGAPASVTSLGPTEVTYNFAGVSASNDVAEEFDIPFTAAVSGTLGTSQPNIEVGLGPLGAAIPDATLPSTDIVRFAKDDIVVQEGTSRIITKVLFWTGISASNQNLVTLLNPSSSVANLTLDAFTAAGQPVGSSVPLSLPANQSITRTPAELFGTSAGIASIRIKSTGPDVLATAVMSVSGSSEAVPFISRTVASFLVPVVNQGANLQVFNPNSAPVTGTLTLRTEEGITVSSVPVNLPSQASTTIVLANAFNNPSRGYASGDFSAPVAAFESFGDSTMLNALALQPGAGVAALYVPLSVVGNGFQTDVNLINVSDVTVTLRGQLFNGAGAPIEPAVFITMPPREQLARPVTQIFPQTSPIGFIRFEVPQQMSGFFPFYPIISGHAQIRSAQGGSTVIPITAFPLQDQYILAAGTSSNEFQGVTLINPTASAVTVTLQGLSGSGTVLGTATVNLTAGQVVARLISEFLPGGLPANSVIRITASAPIIAAAVTGSNNLDFLRSLPVSR